MPSKLTTCKHSKIETFEDSDGGGFFSECHVCDATGPLKDSIVEARKALKKLRAKRPSRLGGAREGAGRKKVLPDDKVFLGSHVFPKHRRKIDLFIKRWNKANPDNLIIGRSAALRIILDRFEPVV